MLKTFVFCGPPGAGKDTQARFLAERMGNYEVIGTGEMFRTLFDKGLEIGVEASKYWKKGLLVPNDIYSKLLAEWVKQYDSQKNWILVGVIRNLGQLDFVLKVLSKFNRHIDKVLCFDIDDNSVVKRIVNRLVCPRCGKVYNRLYNPPMVNDICDDDKTSLIQRPDDSESVVRNRLKQYHETMDDVIELFKNRGILSVISADKEIEDVYKEVVEIISE